MLYNDTEAIVLRTYPLGDADKIVVFLTEKFGILRGVAKGAKRLKSRFGGSLEPFSIVEFGFVQKEERELISISKLELVTSYFDSVSQHDAFQLLSGMCEQLIEFLPVAEANQRLYKMTKICFEAIKNEPDKLSFIELYFKIWLLNFCGYLPAWDRCANCSRDLTEDTAGYLIGNFQIICNLCKRRENKLQISNVENQLYRKVLKTSPALFINFAVNRASEVNNLVKITTSLITFVLAKDLKTSRVLTVL